MSTIEWPPAYITTDGTTLSWEAWKEAQAKIGGGVCGAKVCLNPGGYLHPCEHYEERSGAAYTRASQDDVRVLNAAKETGPGIARHDKPPVVVDDTEWLDEYDLIPEWERKP